ncbi:hypothetical protein II5_05856 [Bacillus cereus MSX-A1]|nr:hypothetical protein [Bacillus cereus]EJQ98126.1 hypothetical protein II5_05856 [Bacillus cereus MSX-A1]MDR4293744.1 hypothetical protein [Bacillus cereus]
MKFNKKVLISCIASLSVLTIGTTSFADSAQTLQDTNGSTLMTGRKYCIHPVGISHKVNLTVDNNGYVNLNDSSLNCQYAYRLVGDDRNMNRSISVGETIHFKEWKKGLDGQYSV